MNGEITGNVSAPVGGGVAKASAGAKVAANYNSNSVVETDWVMREVDPDGNGFVNVSPNTRLDFNNVRDNGSVWYVSIIADLGNGKCYKAAINQQMPFNQIMLGLNVQNQLELVEVAQGKTWRAKHQCGT